MVAIRSVSCLQISAILCLQIVTLFFSYITEPLRSQMFSGCCFHRLSQCCVPRLLRCYIHSHFSIMAIDCCNVLSIDYCAIMSLDDTQCHTIDQLGFISLDWGSVMSIDSCGAMCIDISSCCVHRFLQSHVRFMSVDQCSDCLPFVSHSHSSPISCLPLVSHLGPLSSSLVPGTLDPCLPLVIHWFAISLSPMLCAFVFHQLSPTCLQSVVSLIYFPLVLLLGPIYFSLLPRTFGPGVPPVCHQLSPTRLPSVVFRLFSTCLPWVQFFPACFQEPWTLVSHLSFIYLPSVIRNLSPRKLIGDIYWWKSCFYLRQALC